MPEGKSSISTPFLSNPSHTVLRDLVTDTAHLLKLQVWKSAYSPLSMSSHVFHYCQILPILPSKYCLSPTCHSLNSHHLWEFDSFLFLKQIIPVVFQVVIWSPV